MGRRRDERTIARRLKLWKRLAPAGVEVEVIAGHLHITPAALMAMVVRERRRGNPAAVYHANYHGRRRTPPGRAA